MKFSMSAVMVGSSAAAAASEFGATHAVSGSTLLLRPDKFLHSNQPQ